MILQWKCILILKQLVFFLQVTVPMAATTKPVLQEFQPLTNVLQTVPQRLQKGLFSQDVEWTCLDVTKEFLAIGTNVGIVFLYDRHRCTVKRLQCPVKDLYSCGDSSTVEWSDQPQMHRLWCTFIWCHLFCYFKEWWIKLSG